MLSISSRERSLTLMTVDTAVIVDDSYPQNNPVHGETLPPASLGSLEVIEQSLGKAPRRARYDLAAFEAGEMWIYRPIGLESYVGHLMTADFPPSGHTIAAGQ